MFSFDVLTAEAGSWFKIDTRDWKSANKLSAAPRSLQFHLDV